MTHVLCNTVIASGRQHKTKFQSACCRKYVITAQYDCDLRTRSAQFTTFSLKDIVCNVGCYIQQVRNPNLFLQKHFNHILIQKESRDKNAALNSKRVTTPKARLGLQLYILKTSPLQHNKFTLSKYPLANNIFHWFILVKGKFQCRGLTRTNRWATVVAKLTVGCSGPYAMISC